MWQVDFGTFEQSLFLPLFSLCAMPSLLAAGSSFIFTIQIGEWYQSSHLTVGKKENCYKKRDCTSGKEAQ